MAEFPALPLFTDAYLADTRHLTTEEHGAYLLLLICAWRSRGCALRDDDRTLARIAGLSPTRWRRMKPALADFFHIDDGMWRQKKLTAVHQNVAVRVARSKANGAKGGQVSAQRRSATTAQAIPSTGKKACETDPALLPSSHQSANQQPVANVSVIQSAAAKTKTKSKTKQAAATAACDDIVFDMEGWRADARRACGVDTRLDDGVLAGWFHAGVDRDADMIPIITAIKAREIARTGRAPRGLGYYRDGVLEACLARTHATAAQQARIQAQMSAQAAKILFDAANTAHWQQLLGDPASRFRGDYMAQHWFIERDHPVFLPADLGPNPRLSKTRHIPEAIIKIYAQAWGWLPVPAS